MSFPVDVLRVHVEAFLLGEWVDFSDVFTVVDDVYDDVYEDVYGGRGGWVFNRLFGEAIQIQLGRADEFSTVSPATVSVTLDNPDGYLTPGNAMSPWYPDWRRGALMRIRVDNAVRFTGLVSEIDVTWPFGDLTLAGDEPGESRVTVKASGELRRIGQSGAAHSPMYRLVSRDPAVTDYWPLEDAAVTGTLETSASVVRHAQSGLMTGPRPTMILNGVSLGSSDLIPGASGLASVRGGDTATWGVPLTGVEGAWNVGLVFHCPTPPEATQIIRVMNVLTTGDPYRYVVDLNWNTNPEILYQGFYRDGSVAFSLSTQPTAVFGLPVLMELTVSQSGGDVQHDLRWQEIVSDHAYGLVTSPVPGTAGRPAHYSGTTENCPSSGYLFGQVAVRAGVENYWGLAAAQGHNGESAGNRLLRLTAEEDIVFSLAGGHLGTAKMGPQPTATVAELLQDCASTDGGFLFELRTVLGLRYNTRRSQYNRPVELTLDAAQSQIANPFTPVHDDQGVTNDVTVRNVNGGSYRVRDQASIDREGIRDKSLTGNFYIDGQLLDAAGWELHLGTWEGMRVPEITFDLAIAPELTDAWTLITPGDRVQVINLPPQWPIETLDLIFQGWGETLGPFEHSVTANCTPAEPWNVGIIEDDVYGRLDTNSELVDAIDTDDTSFNVATTEGEVWTTYGGSFPFDVKVGGEVMTVTSVTGTVTPQSFTVTRGVNGVAKSHPSGSPLSLAHPAILAA